MPSNVMTSSADPSLELVPQRPHGRRTTYRKAACVILASILALSIGVFAVVGINLRTPAPTSVPIRGADISFTVQEEAIGRVVSDNGEIMPIEEILAERGATHVRLRVWVGAAAGTNDLQTALSLAHRARAAGLRILLALHYSDTWADRGAQETPDAWKDQNNIALAGTVEAYTRNVVAAFRSQGTPVDIVQIGNEITYGMLWPTGCLCGKESDNWPNLALLLRAGIRGARQGDPSNPPATMLHLDTGGDWKTSLQFFDRVEDFGITYDLIGLSYYPFWHGSMDQLQYNLDKIASRYGKDIIVVETAYPWTLDSPEPSVVDSLADLPDGHEYPPTPDGQAEYFSALNRILREVPDGHGLGYFVWEPGWLPGVGATEEVGNTHANLTLFDWNGQGLPALDAFQPAGGADVG